MLMASCLRDGSGQLITSRSNLEQLGDDAGLVSHVVLSGLAPNLTA
jgi:hypothetical protein